MEIEDLGWAVLMGDLGYWDENMRYVAINMQTRPRTEQQKRGEERFRDWAEFLNLKLIVTFGGQWVAAVRKGKND